MKQLVVLFDNVKKFNGLLLTILIGLINLNTASGQRTTFYKDIAPIIEQRCVPCHYPGGPSPFSLTSYKAVASRAKFISYLTENRIMPPWRANSEYVHFTNERIMQKGEIALIKEWIDQGLKKGSIIPKRLENPMLKTLGKPNLVLHMMDSIEIKGDNMNRYVTCKVPYEISQDTFAMAFEFIPGNTNVLHHASFQIIETDSTAKIFEGPYYKETSASQILDDGSFYKQLNLIGKNGSFPNVVYSNSWLPGSGMQIYTEDLAFKIPRTGVILYNYIHYSPSPIAQKDNSKIQFYFSKRRPEKILSELLLKPNFKGIEGLIPKDSVKDVRFKKRLSSPIEIVTVIPHMHKLGKYFKAYAVLPNNDTVPLVEVKDWDFNWQEYYVFPNPVSLPRGTLIIGEAIFDNSENNLSNPSQPPVDVYFEGSMDDTSEMLHLILLVSESKKGVND